MLLNKRAFILILALVPSAGVAQESISIESIAAGYFSSGSYCDAGRTGLRENPTLPYTEELSFVRCAQRDGRFKYVERNERVKDTAKWADSKQAYRYLEYGRRYQELAFDAPILFDLYRDRSQIFPVFVFEVFSSDPRRLVNPSERARYLQAFALSSSLSTPRYSVFERLDPNGKSGERLWVLNESKSIVKHEVLRDGGVVRYVEITSREMNRPLTEADLWYDVPLTARYSGSNNPRVFISGLLVAGGLAGALVWGWLFSRTAWVEEVLRNRRRLWYVQLWLFGGIAVILAALAALTWGGSGHPPAIVYVYAMAVWCSILFGMTVLFTLASYPIELLFKRERE